jgi:hypothetical protein
MRFNAKRAIAALVLCGLAPFPSSAQPEVQKSGNSGAMHRVAGNKVGAGPPRVASRTLTPDDGLAVIAAALDSRIHVRPNRDCSHLVHTIYERAGFPYSYASSSDLYGGANEFQRVAHPQTGDLAVWRGHVGIVVNPAQHVFFSTLRSGPGIDTYDAPYWKERGQVRFYRYIKSKRRSLALPDATDRRSARQGLPATSKWEAKKLSTPCQASRSTCSPLK